MISGLIGRFITPFLGYIAAALGALILVLCLGLWWQTRQLHKTQDEFSAYRGVVVALGKIAEKDKETKETQDKSSKEKADANHDRTVAALNKQLTRLRANAASRSFVPPTGPATESPGLACYDGGELDRAIRTFDKGASELIGKGATGITEINSARQWAASRRK